MRRCVLAPVLMTVAIAAVIGMTAPLPTALATGRAPAAAAAETADPGSVGIRLLDIPAEAQDDPRARTYVVDELAPGTTVQRRVEVSNTTSAPLSVEVYASAAAIVDDSFTGAEGRTQNELSSWTSLDQDVLEIPAGAAAQATVTIAVPADAPQGEQYAAVWAQASGAAGQIAIVNRVGIRMYVAVSGDNPTAAAFTVDSLTASRGADGAATVQAQVHNTGGRALDLSGTLVLVQVGGNVSAGPYPVDAGTTLAPGETAPVVVSVTDDVADGPWDATVDLASGLTLGSGTAQITFPAATGAAPPVTAAVVVDSGMPMILVAAIGVAILLVLALTILVLRRRRRGRRRLRVRGAHASAT
ncbi:hypothetical protein AGMMS50218_12400 [Actinomycetota bacterium]|nr:hypothetical protein AGMMS50218_12400 [Actinomycetota bacterium]